MGAIHGKSSGGSGGSGSDSDEKAKVSSNDTTAGYLNGKLVAGTNITFNENNDGGDETLIINAGGGGASQLSDLSDVNTSTPTNGNVLVADGVYFESRALVEADISDLGSYIEAADVPTNETDPIVGAVTGIVKADGVGNISAAVEDTDYQGVLAEGAFADGDKTKLDTIETSADVTDETNVKSALSGATITNATVAASDKILFQDADDADNLKQDDAQSLANLATPEGTAIKSTGEAGGSKFLRENGDGTCSWQDVPAGGTVDVVSNVGTSTILGRVTAGSGDSEELTAAQVRTLLNVEDGADVTDATNVTAAGALMESEVTNLAQVKAFDSGDYATAAQGALADSAQQPPVEGAFVDGDKTKLDGIEALADVTDATNVGSAMTGATAKTTPVDADTVPINDSAASNVLKKVTWANVKATLKTYFDSLYAASLGADDNYVTDAEKIVIGNTSGTNTGDQDLSGLAVKSNNLSDLTNATTARSNLGLVIGTDVQAYNAALASIAGLTTAADKMIYTTASNTYAVADLSSVARTLIAQTSQSAMRSTGLGLGSLATLSTINNSNWSGTELSVANGGTGASTLTGILKGNGTSAFTAVTAPSGTIVGTTDTQTLTNKTITPADHGTATNPEVVAVVYGTGSPPTASTTPIGTLFIQYTA